MRSHYAKGEKRNRKAKSGKGCADLHQGHMKMLYSKSSNVVEYCVVFYSTVKYNMNQSAEITH